MGFYGNISNVNKSTFQFDKIYPNKAAMETFCAKDGVFVGRYVLVDYDSDEVVTNPSYLNDSYLEYLNEAFSNTDTELKGKTVVVGYKSTVDGVEDIYDNGGIKLYSGASGSTPAYVIGDSVGGNTITVGSYVLVVGKIAITTSTDPGSSGNVGEQGPQIITSETFEKINPELYYCDSANETTPHFTEKASLMVKNIYGLNFQIDSEAYGTLIGRGWDSTVWQKTYRDGQAKYVMVAELNSVVPTFDISVDAPTSTPLKPHFDADSSNVYYKLHVQPQWGLRLKASTNTHSTDTKTYPSDVKGTFFIHSELNDSNTLVTTSNSQDLAVYFNKEGFNKNRESTIDQDITRKKITGAANIANAKVDNILIQPTGTSNNTYNYHDGSGTYRTGAIRPDTYEMSILLPSLGSAVSSMWNAVYGAGTNRDVKNRVLWNKDTGEFAEETISGSNITVKPEQALRNTNIEWDSHNGQRLVVRNSNGTLTYNKDSINSLASSINSVHDLMGMIIRTATSTSANNVAQWDPSRIYYVNGKYYKKAKTYTYDSADSTQYKAIGTMINPAAGSYFRKEVNQFPALADEATLTDEEKAVANTLYNDYKKVTSTDDVVDGGLYGTITQGSQVAIDVANYVKNRYYYRETAGTAYNYILDTAEKPSAANGVYWAVTATQLEGQEFYIPGRYYVGVKNNPIAEWNNKAEYTVDDFDTFVRCEDETLAAVTARYSGKGIKFYRNVTIKQSSSSGTVLVEDKTNPIIVTRDWPENTDNFTYENGILTLLRDSGEPVDGGVYSGTSVDAAANTYKTPVFKVEENENNYTPWEIYENEYTYKTDTDGNKIQAYNFKTQPAPVVYSLDDAKMVDLREFNDGNRYFYLNNKNYYQETWAQLKTYYASGKETGGFTARNTLNNNKIQYYTLAVAQQGVYYTVNGNYYYKDSAGNWLRETTLRITPDKNYQMETYYNVPTFRQLSNTQRLFVPNKYYTKSGDTYTLADTFATGTTYYEKVGRYVISDSNNIYKQGAEWNEAVTVPTGVTVGARTETWYAQELVGFAENLNTIHGLILKINNVLLTGDELTRDTNTVQGAINTMNDIMAKFATLTPGQIVTVDAYGRIHSASLSTSQSGAYSNWGNGDTGNIAAAQNRWVSVAVNSAATGPSIKVEHRRSFTTTDTTTTTNKNGNGDTINLITPIVDSYGHIIGKNTETVTLPYGFKTISTGAASAAVTNGGGNSAAVSLIADSTQDTLTISPSNKWVRIAGTANTDTLTIGHQVNIIDTVAAAATNLNTGSTTTLDIPDISYDEAGHITAKKTHSYTLPYNFKTLTVGAASDATDALTHATGNVVADGVYDTATIAPGNKWITMAADATNDKITIAHSAGITASTVGDSSAQTPSFGGTFKALQVGRDQAGHVTTLSAHDVTIPTPSLTNGTGNVVTGLSLTPATGAFTESKANVGTLALTGYAESSSISAMPAATDSINTAISKLAYVLNNSTTQVGTRITNAINDLDSTVNQTAGIDGLALQVVETNGKLTNISGSIAANTYEPYGVDISSKSITAAATAPTVDDSTTTLTVAQMLAKIKDLEARVKELEGA